jgi:hypothetical protein
MNVTRVLKDILGNSNIRKLSLGKIGNLYILLSVDKYYRILLKVRKNRIISLLIKIKRITIKIRLIVR